MSRLFSKADHKRLKGFWKGKWIPDRSPELWCSLVKPGWDIKDTRLILDGMMKLAMEKKVTLEQYERMKEMLNSPDEGNRFMAIMLMYGVAKRRFDRRKNTV